jgi:hypothetical protein
VWLAGWWLEIGALGELLDQPALFRGELLRHVEEHMYVVVSAPSAVGDR